MSTPIEIRVLGEKDAPHWWNLRLEALQGDALAFGRTVEEHQATPVSVIESRLRDTETGNFTLGAWQAESLVGAATFVRETAPLVRHQGHIYAVYVSPSVRGRRVGRQLMESLISRAMADPSLDQILLAVSETQDVAHKLYLSCGFRDYGKLPGARRFGDRQVAEYFMVLTRAAVL